MANPIQSVTERIAGALAAQAAVATAAKDAAAAAVAEQATSSPATVPEEL